MVISWSSLSWSLLLAVIFYMEAKPPGKITKLSEEIVRWKLWYRQALWSSSLCLEQNNQSQNLAELWFILGNADICEGLISLKRKPIILIQVPLPSIRRLRQGVGFYAFYKSFLLAWLIIHLLCQCIIRVVLISAKLGLPGEWGRRVMVSFAALNFKIECLKSVFSKQWWRGSPARQLIMNISELLYGTSDKEAVGYWLVFLIFGGSIAVVTGLFVINSIVTVRWYFLGILRKDFATLLDKFLATLMLSSGFIFGQTAHNLCFIMKKTLCGNSVHVYLFTKH